MSPVFSPACGASLNPIGRPRGLGMNISSSFGSGVDVILVGVMSLAGWRKMNVVVNVRALGWCASKRAVTRV